MALRIGMFVFKSSSKSFKTCIQTSSLRFKSTQSKIGFIGIGNMGSHMARNLISKGHSLVVYDVFPEAVAPLVRKGALAGASPAEVAQQVDKLITMLPSNSNVLEVYEGENGILQGIQAKTLLMDSSTIDPAVSQQVAISAQEKGAIYLDAPVSGGVLAARDATLTFMVGGPEEDFQTAQEILKCMGKNVVHCGTVGCGQAAKICNNMLLGITMIGAAETMNLGMRLGLDAKVLANVLNSSSGRCWSTDVYNPVPNVIQGVPSCNDYNGGFKTNLMTKDLGLAQDAATRTQSPTPMGSVAHQLYRILCHSGYATKDFSVVYKFLQEAAKDQKQ